MFHTTRALVLREVRYKEADRILTLFTDSDGKQPDGGCDSTIDVLRDDALWEPRQMDGERGEPC